MVMSLLINGNAGTLVIEGAFDFESHPIFRELGRQCLDNESIRDISVDFMKVTYLDSSALGMLLLLRERANDCGKSIALINVRDVALKILEVANFGRLFKIN